MINFFCISSLIFLNKENNFTNDNDQIASDASDFKIGGDKKTDCLKYKVHLLKYEIDAKKRNSLDDVEVGQLENLTSKNENVKEQKEDYFQEHKKPKLSKLRKYWEKAKLLYQDYITSPFIVLAIFRLLSFVWISIISNYFSLILLIW